MDSNINTNDISKNTSDNTSDTPSLNVNDLFSSMKPMMGDIMNIVNKYVDKTHTENDLSETTRGVGGFGSTGTH